MRNKMNNRYVAIYSSTRGFSQVETGREDKSCLMGKISSNTKLQSHDFVIRGGRL